ncbi:helix-turn-helix domain-containing protein [Pasteurella skyensis]|uniref:Helix-turn-helix domain-containing protein n=1 Tax=Phocoenobacter skyensis TaxID=97481 RepID=A0AAJ6NBM2_9PAST|nr:helix-turn-helix domain-containing protein [Pasteurella skyensis]MDP8163522.1 helix-turn-helix domain-containing protein [Pasteurella skyensis]MDP8173833.1 helix-turn-helix domain-containing protein [Pasteurella skyensis]MDP8179978.1 helix-turn-helix domain-containing protein [Pasteurella skyensis]MDP8184079.1 helix-turn-helix domain-containing protein [Pasteurella skyensis]MDP8190285.1 helix-turn-helix domain-containing protein [Pasteurella skyensis]
MVDIDNIDIKTHEFTGQELGELLLQSVKQMKNNEVAKEHTVTVNNAVEARQKVGLSQREFAKIMGVSVRTLQAWEQGKRQPSGSAITLLKIATQKPQVLLSIL